MKVALVSAYSLDSTMPLAKHLADKNIEVGLIGIMPEYNQNVFVVDFSKNRQPSGFVDHNIATEEMGESLCRYLSQVDTKYFVYPAGAGKKAFFPDIYYAWKLSRYLIKNKFDLVHLIHTGNRFSLLIMHFLRKQKIIQTLHEVTAHSGKTSPIDLKILKILVNKDIPIIFNSQISKDRFLAFRASVTTPGFNNDLYKMIRFSLYETYSSLSADLGIKQCSSNSVPVILHFGRIVPYKGIDVLLDAIRIVQKHSPVHLIVAGGGEPYFSFDGIDSYEFIHRSVSNEEIIGLIAKCAMVVCPYRSSSQSGIPMTVYPFNKPIIASNLGGFKEIIDNEVTGLLVDKIDAVSFANAILYLLSDGNLREKMASNIEKKFRQGEFSWPDIAKTTKSFYKHHL